MKHTGTKSSSIECATEKPLSVRMSMSMSEAWGCSPNRGLVVFSCACPARLQRFSSGTASSSMTSITCSRTSPSTAPLCSALLLPSA